VVQNAGLIYEIYFVCSLKNSAARYNYFSCFPDHCYRAQ